MGGEKEKERWGGAGGGGMGGSHRLMPDRGVAFFDESYLVRLFILVLLLELKQECWSPLKPNT